MPQEAAMTPIYAALLAEYREAGPIMLTDDED